MTYPTHTEQPFEPLTPAQRWTLSDHHRDVLAFQGHYGCSKACDDAQRRIDEIWNLPPGGSLALSPDEAVLLGFTRFGL